MNKYTIKIENESTQCCEEMVVEKLTFPEAAMAAYNKRSKLGYTWKVISIQKQKKEKENV